MSGTETQAGQVHRRIWRRPSKAGGTGLALALFWCLFTIVWLGRSFVDGMSFFTFLDESAQVLGGRSLDAGGVLYHSFIDSHGPFIFALAQAYGAVFGWSIPSGVRGTNIVLTVVAALMVASSSALAGARARLWAVSLFCGLLAVVWLRQGFYQFSFYPISGAIASIALAGSVIPACLARRAGLVPALVSGLAVVCLVANAYSFAPSAILFAVSAMLGPSPAGRRGGLEGFLAGLAIGLTAFCGYMRAYADIHGYLAFHFAENQFVYAHYIGASAAQFWRSLLPSLTQSDRVHAIAISAAAFGAMALLIRSVRSTQGRPRQLLSAGAMLVGLMLLNGRGATTFQDGTFLYAAMTVFSISIADLLAAQSWLPTVPGTVATAMPVGLAMLIARSALYAPLGTTGETLARMSPSAIPGESDAPVYRLIRRVAASNERILVLSYDPEFYQRADRLPMDGFYAYFKWDADYARAPWFGRPHDLCAALEAAPPPIIKLDEAGTWGYRPRAYIPCLDTILRTRYVEQSGIPGWSGHLYVRTDRLKSAVEPTLPSSGRSAAR